MLFLPARPLSGAVFTRAAGKKTCHLPPGHLFSADEGETWALSDVYPYNATVWYGEARGEEAAAGGGARLGDGDAGDDAAAARNLTRRERPQLVFDEAGRPLALSTSAKEAGGTVSPGDYTYTLLQPVRVW